MALAILEVGRAGASAVELTADAGTNRYYQVRVGRTVRRAHEIDWVDDLYFNTPIAAVAAGQQLLGSKARVTIPANRLDRNGAYAQLFTFKSADGRGPAFSDVVLLAGATRMRVDDDFSHEATTVTPVATALSFESPRRVACRTAVEAFSAPPAVGDLLTQIMRLAAPVVADMLRSQTGGATTGGATPPGANIIAGILDAVLRAVGGQAPPVSGQQSTDDFENRFASPFIFGIDDAILASLIGQVAGPVLQVLPQLANAANQRRLGLTQANNKLVTDILSDVTRRMMLQQVLDAQRQGGTGQPGSAADLAQLAALLQQAASAGAAAPSGPTPGPTAPAAVAPALSLSTDGGTLSKRAVLTFVTGPALPWLGANRVLFSTARPMQLRVRLDVGSPVPKSSLPRAILKVVVKDGATQNALLTQTKQLKDVPANTVIPIDIDRSELAKLPTGVSLAVVAELRWPGGRDCVHKALGATEVTLVAGYFVKDRGGEVGPERELVDMQQFKPFWNKVWEAPILDGATNGDKKHLWELDVTARYSAVIAPDHDANGVMETKVLRAPQEAVTTVDRTAGRLKGGIELSITELNKLMALWSEAPLPPEKLAVFKTAAFAKTNGGDCVTPMRLRGNARERGLVWVVPVFKLVEFTLANTQTTDDAGQVTAVSDEKVHFPIPVAARVLGLKGATGEGGGAAADGPEYKFDGFDVQFSNKVVLVNG